MLYPLFMRGSITLLGGVVVGQSIAVWAHFEGINGNSVIQNRLGVLVVSLLAILLTLTSAWHPDGRHNFEYRSHARWCGPWDNPNSFGMLMGAGILLALGMASGRRRRGKGRFVVVTLGLLAAGLMGRGLLRSYSRGAWLGTVCGLAYLIAISEFKGPLKSVCVSRLKSNWLLAGVILLSVVVLLFWHFQGTNLAPVRRAFSSVNAADFSWRNRVAAWEGDLQIMAEQPRLGLRWNRTEPGYEHYYLPPKLGEGMAIETNDYLMLGAMLGIPALCCFGMYLWLSLERKAESRKQKAGIPKADWMRIVCHAGAIVLLVGFWFDGGLFKLPTAATFWILLELGAIKIPQPSTIQSSGSMKNKST
jgi:hypothetical protein